MGDKRWTVLKVAISLTTPDTHSESMRSWTLFVWIRLMLQKVTPGKFSSEMGTCEDWTLTRVGLVLNWCTKVPRREKEVIKAAEQTPIQRNLDG